MIYEKLIRKQIKRKEAQIEEDRWADDIALYVFRYS